MEIGERINAKDLPSFDRYEKFDFTGSKFGLETGLGEEQLKAIIQTENKKHSRNCNFDKYLEGLLAKNPLRDQGLALLYLDENGQKKAKSIDPRNIYEIYLGENNEDLQKREYFKPADELNNYLGRVAIAKIDQSNKQYGKGILYQNTKGRYCLKYLEGKSVTNKVIGRKSLDDVLVELFV